MSTTGGNGALVPFRASDTEILSNFSEISLSEAEIERANKRSDEDFINMTDEQFPPDQYAWIKDLERRPDQALIRTFKSGIPLRELDEKAPTIRIGIIFMAGPDIITVTRAEQRAMSDGDNIPSQQSPEWRLYTAATLLQKYEVGEDLRVKKEDDSHAIYKTIMNPHARSPSISEDERRFRRASRSPSYPETSQTVVKREILHHALNINSDEVKLLPNLPRGDHDFHKLATLVEVDMLSMKALITNYKTIISGTGKQMAQQDRLMILDTMINDVRRLCTRSPRLFRMSTRSVIAQSEDVRYGVDFGTQFITVTTSEGIRHLIDRSSAYYQSLSDDKVDQTYIRPRFLQMLVLLLSLLNDKDLKSIGRMLEGTYQVPGDRAHLELLIMKVLPLQSINAEIFLEGIFAAYKPGAMKHSYQLREQDPIWKELQQDIARRGFLVPSIAKTASASLGVAQTAGNLEDEFDQDSEDESACGQKLTWLPTSSAGLEGLKISTIFKYLQHDGKLRDEGDSARGSIRAINEIPHLETTSDDRENRVTILFRNDIQYKVDPEQADLINAMTKGLYPLEPLDSRSAKSTLEIDDEPLNVPFIEATIQINKLLRTIRHAIGSRTHRRFDWRDLVSPNGQPSNQLSDIDVPTEAKRVSADIVGEDEKKTVAVAFKVANKIVFQHNILKGMTTTLSKLKHAVEWIDAQKRKLAAMRVSDPNEQRFLADMIKDCANSLTEIRSLLNDAESKFKSLQKMSTTNEADPIKKIMVSNFTQISGPLPEWQNYESTLKSDGETLLVKGRKFRINSWVPDDKKPLAKATFEGLPFQVLLEPLAFGGVFDTEVSLMKGSIVAWLGHYLVALEPVNGVKFGHAVLGYFRVCSQTYTGPSVRKQFLRDVPLSKFAFV